MKNLKRKQRSALEVAIAAAISASCIASGAAVAQDRTLEEIIVTTERRMSTEATTAISMEVLTGDFLAVNQIKDLIDLQNAVPGLQFYQNGSYVQANIRGVGNPSRGGPAEQVGVPIFFDGATQGEEMALASGFFDVGDVQVLRGPQATFVGQSAAGGAILVNSARPDFDGVHGFAEATVGTYGSRKIQAALNMPVTDTFAARIAYMGDERQSFYSNINGPASTGGSSNVPGDQTDANYRIGMLWEPNEKFTLYTKLERTHLKGHGIPQQPNPRSYNGFYDHDNDPLTASISTTSYAPHARGPAPGTGSLIDHDFNPLTPARLFGGTPGPGGVIYDPLDPYTIDRRLDNFRIQTNNRLSLEANYTFDSGISFRSLTSYIQMDRMQAEGQDSAAFSDLTGFHLGPDMLTYSQEFNLISPEGQRLEWLIGAYVSDRHTELSLNIALDNPNCGWQFNSTWTPCPTVGPGPNGGSAFRLYWTSTDDVRHDAFYGQLNFDISDELELTVEGRLNNDHNVQVRQNTFTRALAPTTNNPVFCPGQINNSTFYCPTITGDVGAGGAPLVWKGDIPTYKVGLNWEPVDGHFFYAFVARGYKSGQSTPFGANQIVEEVVDDIEIGWKGTLLDGQLYAELGIYSMGYTDMQMSAFRTSATESDNATVNVGDSSIEGIEGSIRYIVGGFGINGGFGWNDSSIGAITTIDTRSLPIGETGGVRPGDTAKGCTGVFCFDYTPYFITLAGSENLFAPKVTYTFSVDYAFQMSNGATVTPMVSLNHSDTAFSSILQQPGDNYYTTDARDLVNVSITYVKDDWNVQLFGTNVTDDLYIEGVTGSNVLYSDPQVWGVRARMDF
jgi:iron complex outermembrane receptor protein